MATLPRFMNNNIEINREMVRRRREMTREECLEVGMTPAQPHPHPRDLDIFKRYTTQQTVRILGNCYR